MIAVGIAGYMGSGKDTVGQRLVERWGFTRLSFAQPLKDEVARILPRTCREMVRLVGALSLSEEEIALAVARQLHSSHRHPVFRALLQEWGTDLRRAEDEDYWVRRWRDSAIALLADRIVATDCRFLNEAETIREIGGHVVRVQRPGWHGDSHPSETILVNYPHYRAIFQNDGTIADLWKRVDAYMATVLP